MKNLDTPGLADVALGENNEWNELHFVTRQTFATMAPSVLRLEIGRISSWIDSLPLDHADREAFVIARHRLTQLNRIVTTDFESADLAHCEELLSGAILAIGMRSSAHNPESGGQPDNIPESGGQPDNIPESGGQPDNIPESGGRPDNIVDRLGYVLARLRRLR